MKRFSSRYFGGGGLGLVAPSSTSVARCGALPASPLCHGTWFQPVSSKTSSTTCGALLCFASARLQNAATRAQAASAAATRSKRVRCAMTRRSPPLVAPSRSTTYRMARAQRLATETAEGEASITALQLGATGSSTRRVPAAWHLYTFPGYILRARHCPLNIRLSSSEFTQNKP